VMIEPESDAEKLNDHHGNHCEVDDSCCFHGFFEDLFNREKSFLV
jgi:hypothetical protein